MTLGRVLSDVLELYLLILFIRLFVGYIIMFNHNFRPKGAMAVLVDFVYVVTDPPLKGLRKVLPPLRIGRIAFDLGYLVLFVLIGILARAVAQL